MDSIFGEETITPPGSPEGQGADEAVETEDQHEGTPEVSDDHETDDSGTEEDDGNEADEPSDDDDHSEQDEDGLILNKFKSQQDLINAYRNLEREFHKNRQQPPSQPQQPAAPTTPANTEDPAEMFFQSFRENPLGTLNYLIESAVQQRTAPIYEQRADETLAKNIESIATEYKQVNSADGMGKLFDRVREIAEDLGNPSLARNPNQRILRMAAAEVFGDTRQKLYDKAKAAGRQEAESTRQSKRALGAPSATKPKQTEAPKSEADLIRESIRAAGARSGLFG